MTKANHNKPFPIRLGELKPILQAEVSEDENKRSLHYFIKKILKKYCADNDLFEKYNKNGK